MHGIRKIGFLFWGMAFLVLVSAAGAADPNVPPNNGPFTSSGAGVALNVTVNGLFGQRVAGDGVMDVPLGATIVLAAETPPDVAIGYRWEAAIRREDGELEWKTAGTAPTHTVTPADWGEATGWSSLQRLLADWKSHRFVYRCILTTGDGVEHVTPKLSFRIAPPLTAEIGMGWYEEYPGYPYYPELYDTAVLPGGYVEFTANVTGGPAAGGAYLGVSGFEAGKRALDRDSLFDRAQFRYDWTVTLSGGEVVTLQSLTAGKNAVDPRGFRMETREFGSKMRLYILNNEYASTLDGAKVGLRVTLGSNGAFFADAQAVPENGLEIGIATSPSDPETPVKISQATTDPLQPFFVYGGTKPLTYQWWKKPAPANDGAAHKAANGWEWTGWSPVDGQTDRIYGGSLSVGDFLRLLIGYEGDVLTNTTGYRGVAGDFEIVDPAKQLLMQQPVTVKPTITQGERGRSRSSGPVSVKSDGSVTVSTVLLSIGPEEDTGSELYASQAEDTYEYMIWGKQLYFDKDKVKAAANEDWYEIASEQESGKQQGDPISISFTPAPGTNLYCLTVERLNTSSETPEAAAEVRKNNGFPDPGSNIDISAPFEVTGVMPVPAGAKGYMLPPTIIGSLNPDARVLYLISLFEENNGDYGYGYDGCLPWYVEWSRDGVLIEGVTGLAFVDFQPVNGSAITAKIYPMGGNGELWEEGAQTITFGSPHSVNLWWNPAPIASKTMSLEELRGNVLWGFLFDGIGGSRQLTYRGNGTGLGSGKFVPTASLFPELQAMDDDTGPLKKTLGLSVLGGSPTLNKEVELTVVRELTVAIEGQNVQPATDGLNDYAVSVVRGTTQRVTARAVGGPEGTPGWKWTDAEGRTLAEAEECALGLAGVGQHRLTATATVGGESASATLLVTVEDGYPELDGSAAFDPATIPAGDISILTIAGSGGSGSYEYAVSLTYGGYVMTVPLDGPMFVLPSDLTRLLEGAFEVGWTVTDAETGRTATGTATLTVEKGGGATDPEDPTRLFGILPEPGAKMRVGNTFRFVVLSFSDSIKAEDLTWTSGEDALIALTADGHATLLGEGYVTVTATLGTTGRRASYSFRIGPADPADPEDPDLPAGYSVSIQPRLFQAGKPILIRIDTNPPAQIRVEGLPDGLMFTDGTIVGELEEAGDYPISVTITWADYVRTFRIPIRVFEGGSEIYIDEGGDSGCGNIGFAALALFLVVPLFRRAKRRM